MTLRIMWYLQLQLFQGYLLICSPCSPLGGCKCLLSCIIPRMTEIITVRNKKNPVIGGKKECLDFLNSGYFPIWPDTSYAGTQKLLFKELLPAHCLTGLRMAVSMASQRTAGRPQPDRWGELSGLGIGFIGRFN